MYESQSMKNFSVGNIVIDTDDRIGYIKKICECENCQKRG